MTLEPLDKTALGAELGLLAELEELFNKKGFRFVLNPNEVARKLKLSDSTVRRTLKKFAELNLLKLGDEVRLNPHVFGGLLDVFEKLDY